MLQAWGDSVQKLSSVAFDLAGINVKGVVVSTHSTRSTRSVGVWVGGDGACRELCGEGPRRWWEQRRGCRGGGDALVS